eukprot:Nk52_evm10s1671 gene=Nk52_evmTU10s1671
MVKLAIVLFDNVEVLDVCGPFEVFGVAKTHGGAGFEGSGGISPSSSSTGKPAQLTMESLLTVSQNGEMITARNGLKMVPDFSFANCPPVDILLVPGGMGSRREMHNEAMLRFVRERSKSVCLLLSVCTGALILGKAGLLGGLSVATHWRAVKLMREEVPGCTVVEKKRFVVSNWPFEKSKVKKSAESGDLWEWKEDIDVFLNENKPYEVEEVEMATESDPQGAVAGAGRRYGGRLVTSGGISSGIDMAFYVVARLFGIKCARETALAMEYDLNEAVVFASSVWDRVRI